MNVSMAVCTYGYEVCVRIGSELATQHNMNLKMTQ